MSTVSGRLCCRNTMGYSSILDATWNTYSLHLKELWDVDKLRQTKRIGTGRMYEGLVAGLVLCRVLSGGSVQPLCDDGLNKKICIYMDNSNNSSNWTYCSSCHITDLLTFFLIYFSETISTSECMFSLYFSKTILMSECTLVVSLDDSLMDVFYLGFWWIYLT